MKDDLRSRSLYLCTPDRPDLVDFLQACLEGGVDVVQLRDKEADDQRLVATATRALAICRRYEVPFIVNDRPDLALATGADGVHVGQDDASPLEAREVVGPDAIVGLSTHARGELERGIEEPVTYLSAGPVVPTPTKQGRPGTGPAYISYANEISPWPVFVTGGVTPATVPDLVRAGARHFVVVRYLTEAPDPYVAAQDLRRAIESSLHSAPSMQSLQPPDQRGHSSWISS